jgi:transposase
MSYRAYSKPAPRRVGYDPVKDLPSNHLAWLIESTVEDALQNRVLPARVGQPPFDPRLCTKVLIYGYATGIRSSRQLERNCRENLPFLLLTRGDTPSYRTLCSFRVEHADLIEEVWVELFAVAKELGFKRLGRLVLDSSKFLADASPESVVPADEYEAVRRELQAVLKEATEVDQKEDQQSPGMTTLDKEVKPDLMREILRRVRKQLAAKKKKTGAAVAPDSPGKLDERAPTRRVPGPGMIPRIQAALKTLDEAEQEELKHACLTDPDARLMKEGRDKPIKECHSFEVAVDKDAELLVVGQVTQDSSDHGRLVPLIDAARPHEPQGIVAADADSGYYKGEVIAQLQEEGIDTCVPDGFTAKRLRSEDHTQNTSSPPTTSDPSVALRYDAERDIFVCAADKVLSGRQTRKQGGRAVKIYVAEMECTGCPLAAACLRNSTSKRRTTSRAVDENNPIDVALARFTDPDHQQRYHDRGMIVETVFAFLRHILGYRRWMVRGKKPVAAEGTLFKTAYQFRKVHCAWKFASTG